MRFIFWTCFAMAVIFTAVNGRRRNNIYQRTDSVFASVEKFSSNLYSMVSATESENVVTSPLGLGFVLSLFAMNASVPLLEEMENIFSIPKENITENFERLSIILNTSEFKLSYEIISLKSTTTSEPFNKIQATSTINFSLENHVVSMNFNAKWREPFSEYSTTRKRFYTVDRVYYVPTMNADSYFICGNISGVEASFIEIPYQGDVYMLIVLPDEINGLQEVEKSLATLSVQDIKRNKTRAHIDLELPKFKVEVTTDFTEALKKMGLGTSFMNSRNYENLAQKNLSQTAFIEVAETGVLTDYENDGFSFIPVTLQNAMSFKVNHPFHYKIVKRVSDTEDLILFVGNVKGF